MCVQCLKMEEMGERRSFAGRTWCVRSARSGLFPPSQFPAHPLPFCSFLGGILVNDGYCKFTSGCEFPIIAKQRVPASTRGTWMTPGHQHRTQIQAAQLSPARLGGISTSGAKETPSLDRAVLLGRGRGKAEGIKQTTRGNHWGRLPKAPCML